MCECVCVSQLNCVYMRMCVGNKCVYMDTVCCIRMPTLITYLKHLVGERKGELEGLWCVDKSVCHSLQCLRAN